MRLRLVVAATLSLSACGDDSQAGTGDDTSEGSSSTSSGAATSGPDLESSSSDGTTGAAETDETGSSTGSEGSSSTGKPPGEATPWEWALPSAFPMPLVPEDNPMTVEGVELGRHLFYDTRLSVDGSFACSTCHEPALAFTDGRAQAVGVTGQAHTRGSMSLANVAYASTLAWANPELLDLETHALVPMFGTVPVEMGLVDEADVIARIEGVPRYQELFAAAYPGDPEPMTLEHVTAAIASFQRSLISGTSPFDRWFYGGDEDAVSDAVKRGWELFNVPGECTYCHFGHNFSNASYFEGMPTRPYEFQNTALYNLDGQGAYPEGNEGLFSFTGDPADMGRFKAPTLRNIAVTAPYMHDGSIETLEDMLDHYSTGGREVSPLADAQMRVFELSESETADFVAFLESLTDEAFLTDPAHANPWDE